MYCCLWKDMLGCSEYIYFIIVFLVRFCFVKLVLKWKIFNVDVKFYGFK